MQDADLDRVLGLGGECRRQGPSAKSRRGGKQAAAERSLGDRANRCVHRDVLLLTRKQTAQSRPQRRNCKRHAKLRPDGKPLPDLTDLTIFERVRALRGTRLLRD